jgi:hypothetical protein
MDASARRIRFIADVQEVLQRGLDLLFERFDLEDGVAPLELVLLSETLDALLALAGYLTGNATYSNTAASVISQRFIRRVPL